MRRGLPLTYRPSVSESLSRMRLFRVHPLDAPVVALAVETEGPDPDYGMLIGVAAVKFHAGKVVETFESDAAGLFPAFPVFAGDSPITGHDLGAAAG